MKTLLSVLRHYTRFSGRSGQGELFAICFLTLIVEFAFALALGSGRVTIPHRPGSYVLLIGGTGPAAALLTLAIYLPLFAAVARRLHDQGRTAWFAFALPITFLALDILTPLSLYIGFLGIAGGFGTPGPNRYGPDPRENPTRSAAA
jgi:hypothetical protein